MMVEFAGDDQAEDRGAGEQVRVALLRRDAVDARLIGDREQQEQSRWLVRENGVGSSRVPRNRGKLAVLGGRRGAPGAARRLSARLRQAQREVRLQIHAVRASRRRLHAFPHNFGLKTDEGVARSARFMQEAADLCLAYGGSLSGEHGDGQAKGELLPKMFGPELIQAFRDFKAIWDPAGKMNPASDRRLSARRQPAPRPRLPPAAGRDLLQVPGRPRQLRARGRALLRRGQVPQPRGRDDVPELPGDARGNALDARPRPPAVRDDARRRDQGRLARPHIRRRSTSAWNARAARATARSASTWRRTRPSSSRITTRAGCGRARPTPWADLPLGAARVAGAGAGQLRHAAPCSATSSSGGRLSRQRAYARRSRRETFRRVVRRRGPREPAAGAGGALGRHVQQPFHPETAQAAVEVLEAAGCRVDLPRASSAAAGRSMTMACWTGPRGYCGRRWTALRPAIRARHADRRAGAELRLRLPRRAGEPVPETTTPGGSAGSVLLSELLAEDQDYRPPQLRRHALVHGHCHHKAVLGIGAESELLTASGSIARRPRPAAAASPARSASRPGTTTCR